MIEPEKRKAIYLLSREGMSVREIARRLHVSRNAVRNILRHGAEAPPASHQDKIRIKPERLRELYEKCEGWKQRIKEMLEDEDHIKVAYSTLTRMLRELGIGPEPKPRSDRVPDEPGAEMQHDTSPYVLEIGGQKTPVIGSSIYLRYSKRRYLRFYRRFDRFRMKCFLHEALMHWGYAAKICIIDNTNLARLRGSGKNAVIVPEMAAFAKERGFEFICHAIGHSNRKAGEERSFWTVETNFFPGRTFRDFEDLIAQAIDWSTVRIYHRPLTKSRIIPAVAFEHERTYLVQVPAHLPAPYRVHERGTDQYGYVSFGANYFWVPGKGRDDVKVIEYADRLKIYRGREMLVEYLLPPEGTRNVCVQPPGQPKPRHEPRHRQERTLEEEKRLRALDPAVGKYLDADWTPKGAGRHRFLRELFRLSGRMTPALFVRTIERALKYRIDNLEVIWRIALMHVQDGLDALPAVDLDETFTEREAYREGALSDEPDFSRYDDDPSEEENDG
jgi:transposase